MEQVNRMFRIMINFELNVWGWIAVIGSSLWVAIEAGILFGAFIMIIWLTVFIVNSLGKYMEESTGMNEF